MYGCCAILLKGKKVLRGRRNNRPCYMKDYYKDKWVWITGASSGIGRELAIQASARGAKLLLASRRVTELESLQRQLDPDGNRSRVLELDLADYHAVGKKIATVADEIGAPDVLLQNGGISQRSLTRDTVLTTYETLMNVNFMGSVAITLELLPRVQGRALQIGVVSSVAGKIGTPMRSGYSASKFAVVGFYHSLRAEMEKQGIRVSMIYPGWINTDVSRNALTGDGSPTGQMDAVIEQGIPVEKCAKRILDGMARGEREILIAGSRERFGLFLQKWMPNVFFKMIQNARVQ